MNSFNIFTKNYYIKPIKTIAFLLLAFVVQAQSPWKITYGVGRAAYVGDLIEKPKILGQSSMAFSIGASYDITPQFKVRGILSTQKVKAYDSKNERFDYRERNLSFISPITELQVGAEYEFLDISNWEYILTPYATLGLAVYSYNPFTYDKDGVKQYLREWRTEGQGLPGYAKPYGKFGLSIPMGAGVRYVLSEQMNIGFEVNFRKTFNDYIDDVSMKGYPDFNVLSTQGRPGVIDLTFRGAEVIQGKPYPGIYLPRGNPNQPDNYYSFVVHLQVSLDMFNGGGGGAGRMRW